MSPVDALAHPHRRRNPLTGRWIVVSAERTQRPWQGGTEPSPPERRPRYDPACYLCPTNRRASGEHNPDYTDTYVFTNDFAALRPDTPEQDAGTHPLLRAHTEAGTCRVLCFSPRHDLALAEMDQADVRRVVDLWADQLADLARGWRWVQLFENRGEMMGASNPHPHGQLWASGVLPDEPSCEDARQRAWRDGHDRPLLLDYADLEAEKGERVVCANAAWLVIVPFWAAWPFETLLLPRRHVASLTDLSEGERNGLADVLRRLLVRYDNVFQTAFPYSMGWHGAHGRGLDGRHWQLHAHFYPPLLRSASVRKFMVGYELLADEQRDLTAEHAAERLRDLPERHFREAARAQS